MGTVDRRLRVAAMRPPASPDGPNLVVRVLPERWRSLSDLVLQDVLSEEIATLLLNALRSGATIPIGGGVGSGKTTLAAALLLAIGNDRLAVVIEESTELPQLPDSLSVEVGRSGLSFAEWGRFSLRQKPDLIVVGEARGPEALALLQAANSGHPSVATIHALDIDGALRNLERMACERGTVPAAIVRGMMTSNAAPIVVCHIGRYRGKRMVGMVAEVSPMGASGHAGDRFVANPLFAFNPQLARLEKVSLVTGRWGLGRY
jgi:pilus assembly protein CpaF